MGLGYFFIFLTIFGAGALAVVLLKAAWKLWNSPKWRALAVLPFLLALPCGYAAVYLVAVILREGFYSF